MDAGKNISCSVKGYGSQLMSKLRILAATAVVIIWAVGYTISFIDRTYNPPAELSAIMLAVVTWLLSTEVKDRLNIKITKKSDDKDENPPSKKKE